MGQVIRVVRGEHGRRITEVGCTISGNALPSTPDVLFLMWRDDVLIEKEAECLNLAYADGVVSFDLSYLTEPGDLDVAPGAWRQEFEPDWGDGGAKPTYPVNSSNWIIVRQDGNPPTP